MKNILKQANPIAFFTIFSAAFSLILYKVWSVPVTHDEVGTAVHYSTFSFWEITQFPDSSPNNHILNTLLSKISIHLFGNEQWALRLPNVLSFLLYTWGAYRVLNTIIGKQSYFYIAGALLFIGSPYLLDFFSLCRGYGISSAFCLASFSYLITGYKHSNNRHIWIALILSTLACYANFTLLVFWAAINLWVFIYFLVNYRTNLKSFFKHFLIHFLISGAYLLLILAPIIKMQGADEFRFWTSQGFIEETIKMLVRHSLYWSNIFLSVNAITWFILGLIAVNTLYIITKLIRSKWSKEVLCSPISIATLTILTTAFINILQCWLLNTPNLNGRTALFFYPMFIVTLISTHDILKRVRFSSFKIGVSVIVMFFISHHLITRTNSNSVREWFYDQNTYKVLAYLEKQPTDDKVTLATNWLFNPSFTFYDRTGKSPKVFLYAYNKNIEPESDAQFYYILDTDFPILEERYERVIQFENGNSLLKLKKSK